MMKLFSIDFPYFLHLVTHLKNLERDGGPPKGSTSKITLFFQPRPSNDRSKKADDQKY